MRHPERIKPMLEAIQEIWEAHPDWRLGQLLENVVFPVCPCAYLHDLYYLEDDELGEALRKFLDNG